MKVRMKKSASWPQPAPNLQQLQKCVLKRMRKATLAAILKQNNLTGGADIDVIPYMYMLIWSKRRLRVGPNEDYMFWYWHHTRYMLISNQERLHLETSWGAPARNSSWNIFTHKFDQNYVKSPLKGKRILTGMHAVHGHACVSDSASVRPRVVAIGQQNRPTFWHVRPRLVLIFRPAPDSLPIIVHFPFQVHQNSHRG